MDEIGFLKKGTHLVGVGRQYSGTAGRIENCQVGVFLGYASPLGQARIDRRLICRTPGPRTQPAAAVPERIAFATKTAIARDLIGAALNAGTPCAWVLTDALYGSDSGLRRMLEERRQPYVLAVRSTLTLRFVTKKGIVPTDPAELADGLNAGDWASHAAGEGTKGIRLYDWARIALPWWSDEGCEHWVLIRRNRAEAAARADYMVFAPTGTSLADLAGVAGLRWTIEACFQCAKEELGLDHCGQAASDRLTDPGMAGTAT